MYGFILTPTMPDHRRMTMERLRAWHDAEPAAVLHYFGQFFDFHSNVQPIPYGSRSTDADDHEGAVMYWEEDTGTEYIPRLTIFGHLRDARHAFDQYLADELRSL